MMTDWADETLDAGYYADADLYYGIGESSRFERTQPRGSNPPKSTPPKETPTPAGNAAPGLDIFGVYVSPETQEATKIVAAAVRADPPELKAKITPKVDYPSTVIGRYRQLRDEGVGQYAAADQAIAEMRARQREEEGR